MFTFQKFPGEISPHWMGPFAMLALSDLEREGGVTLCQISNGLIHHTHLQTTFTCLFHSEHWLRLWNGILYVQCPVPKHCQRPSIRYLCHFPVLFYLAGIKQLALSHTRMVWGVGGKRKDREPLVNISPCDPAAPEMSPQDGGALPCDLPAPRLLDFCIPSVVTWGWKPLSPTSLLRVNS